jgi:hypothetical protein
VLRSYQRLAEAGIEDDQVLGILVEEQLTGIEILIGLRRSSLGEFLTIGTGGGGAGRGSAARTLLLPVARSAIEAAAADFIRPVAVETAGAVGAVDLIERMCREFDGGRLSSYSTIEVNPLFVSDDRSAIADVLLADE